MDESPDQSFRHYEAAREAMERGDLVVALDLLGRSLEADVHFKTLELIGELRLRLGQPREAIVPLAAATTLNRGARAPCLLAEVFLELARWSEAHDAAIESLRRAPGYRRALAALDRAERELAEGSATADHDADGPRPAPG